EPTLRATVTPPSRLFGRPTTRQWEKLPCRISALSRDGRNDPIVRCALCYSTIAERRSDSTTGFGRVPHIDPEINQPQHLAPSGAGLASGAGHGTPLI